jgi:hypothetical protein
MGRTSRVHAKRTVSSAADLYERCLPVVMGLGFSGNLGGTLLPYLQRVIQDAGFGFPRRPLPRIWVNNGNVPACRLGAGVP